MLYDFKFSFTIFRLNYENNLKYLIKISLLILLYFFTATFSQAQTTRQSTLSGFIFDAESGEDLISANIYILELWKKKEESSKPAPA